MITSLSRLLQRLHEAQVPADIFGPLAGDKEAALRRRYRELAALAHPDANPDMAVAAHEAFRLLQEWYAMARRQITQGSYGATPLLALQSATRLYESYGAPLAGDLCDLYQAEGSGEPVLLKIARAARNNDLLAAEARALNAIDQGLAGQGVRAHFPTLREVFLIADAAGARRQVNVLVSEAGTLSLAELLRRCPAGLNPADAAWIFNRILAALGVTHSLGLVHGAVLPEHLLIRPADHNGILIDWCYSVPIGEPLRAISRPRAADYPPEVEARGPATPATDLYMAARCLSHLLGGDGSADNLPQRVSPAITALLRSCLISAPRRRPDDAWQLFDDFGQILRRQYGPPVFRPFPITI